MQCWKQLLQLRLCQHQVLLAAQLGAIRWKRVSTTGWKRVQHAKKQEGEAGQLALCHKLLEDGWSVNVEQHTLACFQRLRDGVFMANVMEAKMMMSEMHSNGSLTVVAPVNLNEKGAEISVLVQDGNGCMQCRQRFLHQLARVRHRKEEKWEMEERSKLF